MSIEKQPSLRPVMDGFRPDDDVLVVPLCLTVENAGSAAPHAHPRGQLVWATEGVLRAKTPQGVWIVPPLQALWIPPHVEHDVDFVGKVTLYSLFVAEHACLAMPPRCAALQASPLLQALILDSPRHGDRYAPNSPAARLMQVLLDEMVAAPITALELPACRDPRLERVLGKLSEAPAVRLDWPGLAALACTSERTLARLCVAQTGLPLGEWNRRLVLHTALMRLDRGQSVTQVALALGYTHPSSFVAMFRSALGVSPAKYVRNHRQQA